MNTFSIYRRLHGISLEEISSLSGLAISTLSMAERGKVIVHDEFRRRAYQALKIAILKSFDGQEANQLTTASK